LDKVAISTLKNVVVLYVEDEQLLRDIVTKSLSGFTKKQYVAKDGEEGLALFKTYQDEIDLVITDINMPRMNGLEMSRAIKSINQNVPIIVATAFSNTEYLLEAIDLGIDKYVLKPIDMNKLISMMSKSLLYHELQDLYKDDLTKLPNRNKLKKDLEDTPDDVLALINIDQFSTINDLLGEEMGDKLLIAFADKIKEHFPNDAFKVYRVEADKFAIVTRDTKYDIDLFFGQCKDFITTIEAEDIIVDDNKIDLNITIGIAKSQYSDAYKHAQRVLYYAREKLKSIMIYDESLNIKQNFEDNLKWIKKIKHGIFNDKFKAFFQPIVDNKDGKIIKYEALIRYIDEDGKAVPPIEFLTISKKAKLYPEITKYIIKECIKSIREKGIKVSMNISFDDISSKETVDTIMDLIETNQDISSNLSFEILESESIADFMLVKEFIQKVRQYGCQVGIDDFGAGYSNFNILLELDVDFVKIDGSLIKNIDVNSNVQIIVQTIIAFCKKLGLTTVAEFVSSEGVYQKVAEFEVDCSQGYHFGKPESL
jgi:diguanylate cyclase (GGDEF)-like protein